MAHIFASFAQHELLVSDGPVLLLDFYDSVKVLSPSSVSHYAAFFSDRLDARCFFMGLRIDEHSFHMTLQRRLTLTAAGAWLQRWIYFGGRKAA